MDFRLLDSLEKVAEVSAGWRHLLEQSSCHRAFSSPSWFVAAIQAFEELKPRVIVAENAGQLVGVAPLVWDANDKQLCLLSKLGDYQDFIVALGDRCSTKQLLQVLRGNELGLAAAELAKIKLAGLKPDSNIRSCLPPETLLDSEIHDCYFSDLSDGYEAYLKTRSGNFRYNLRRAIRRAEQNNIVVQELTSKNVSAEALAPLFLELHLSRFPDKLFSRSAPQRFCHLVLPRLFEDGSLRVFALIEEQKAVGVHLAVQDVTGMGIWNGGFDPRVSAVSPGKLLINKQIKVCCEEGFSRYDFMRGDEPYKRSWSTGRQKIGALAY